MGWKFRKSVKIAPGVRLNVSNKSTSISVGGKGYRKTYSSTGRTTTTVRIPGTGLSYSTTENSKSKKTAEPNTPAKKPPSPKTYKTCGIIIQVLSVPLLILSVLLMLVTPVAGIISALFACYLFWMGQKYRKEAVTMNQEAMTDSVVEGLNDLDKDDDFTSEGE